MNKRYSILLVEDDEVDIMNIQRAFIKNNIKEPFYIARNGVEALEMLRNPESFNIKVKPQFLIVDLNMPKKGGLELLHDIRTDPHLKRLTVFIMTTSNEIKDRTTAYEYNAAGYIIKPLSFAEFVEAIGALNQYINICELPE
jgi:CheY-like chemotaxis protein